MIRFEHHPQFVTITNLNWLPVLESNHHKQILIEALNKRVEKEIITIYGFVIMPNHFHAIWQLHDGVNRVDFQRDLLKFTARSLLHFMLMNDDPILHQLKVKTSDRNYQVWERNSLSVDLFSEKVFFQKLDYIHANPLKEKWKLAKLPEEYRWSSASYYETGVNEFDFLTHYRS